MAEAHELPTWRYYADGRSVLVHTPQEYANLEPGHSDTPSGPFPAREPDPEPAAGPESRARARHLRDEGRSRRAIAAALGVTEYTVRRWLEDP